MQLDPQTIGTEAMYKLMIGCVVPRPIAWVSSVDAEGVANLAPFSYFMAITHDPPTIAFSASPRAEAGGKRGKKDTLRHARVRGQHGGRRARQADERDLGRLRARDRRVRAGEPGGGAQREGEGAACRGRTDQHGVPGGPDHPDRQRPE